MVRDLDEFGINLQRIITRLQANQNLLKLLYYSDPDPLSKPDLTPEEIKTYIFNKLIKIVPRVGPKETAQSLIAMRVVRGRQDSSNDQFMSFLIQFEVFVPMTEWLIKSNNLRPFAILSEIKKTLNKKVITGIGKMEGGDFDLNFLTDEMSCYEMSFQIVDYE